MKMGLDSRGSGVEREGKLEGGEGVGIGQEAILLDDIYEAVV